MIAGTLARQVSICAESHRLGAGLNHLGDVGSDFCPGMSYSHLLHRKTAEKFRAILRNKIAQTAKHILNMLNFERVNLIGWFLRQKIVLYYTRLNV